MGYSEGLALIAGYCAFGATFILAVAIAALSLFPDKSWLGVAAIGASWCTFLVLLLFLYAYRRALSLINPIRQLGFVVDHARRDLSTWGRRAERSAPLFKQPKSDKEDSASSTRSTHDLTRVAYFQLNGHWTNEARVAITHAVSFARRYADQGDHEVSGAALAAIVHINASYIAAKGKTFFGHNVLLDNPISSDGLINDTLEHFRQLARIAVARRDERQIEQIFQAMAVLFHQYLRIDYSNSYVSKTHAHLAAGYLSNAVQSVLPNDMADVVMEGIRLMGQRSSARQKKSSY